MVWISRTRGPPQTSQVWFRYYNCRKFSHYLRDCKIFPSLILRRPPPQPAGILKNWQGANPRPHKNWSPILCKPTANKFATTLHHRKCFLSYLLADIITIPLAQCPYITVGDHQLLQLFYNQSIRMD